MIISNVSGLVTCKITPAVIDVLDERRIFCDHQYGDGPRRWRVGEVIQFQDSLKPNRYTGYLAGHTLYESGSFSYAHTEMDPDFSCGRYCSLSWNLTFSGWQHPVASVTSSLATCNPYVAMVSSAIKDMGLDRLRMVGAPQKDTPTIGHDVWIGANVVLMRGVTIGTGAIIANNSIVTKSVPPYAIVGGNPARHIRWRYPEEIVARMLASEWWQYRLDDLQDLDFTDPAAFLDGLQRIAPDLTPWPDAERTLLEDIEAA